MTQKISPPLLKALLTLIRGRHRLFEHLSLILPSGTLSHVQGPNGSGKSSLLGALAGLLPIEALKMEWQGKAVSHLPVTEVLYLGHRLGLTPSLTVQEQLDWMQCAASAWEYWQLPDLLNQTVCRLSRGQQQKLALTRLCNSSAKLWLLDEPFTHLDESGSHLLTALLYEHRSKGGSLLISSHLQLPNLIPDQFLELKEAFS